MLDAPVSGGERGAIDGDAVDHGRRQPTTRSRARRRSSRRSGRTSCTSVRAARGRWPRRATSSSSRRRSRRWPRRSCWRSARASTPPRCARRCSAGSRARRSSRSTASGCSTARSTPGFRIRLHRKDARIVEEAAAATGTPIPAFAVVAEQLQRAVDAGDGRARSQRVCSSSSNARRPDDRAALQHRRLPGACDARVVAVTPLGLVLDRTVAYARGGGQPGDTGVLTTDAGELAIVDTFVDRESGELIHALAEGAVPPAVGAPVRVAIDVGSAPNDHADPYGAACPQRHRLHRTSARR